MSGGGAGLRSPGGRSTMSGTVGGRGMSGLFGCSCILPIVDDPARGPVELMLSRFFHAWERRLADSTKDRVVRPFEWGVDWIEAGARHDAADASVERWVEEVMRDTPGFF